MGTKTKSQIDYEIAQLQKQIAHDQSSIASWLQGNESDKA